MLIDDGDGVGKRLGRGFSVAVLVQLVLLLVVTQLIEQALAKIAASNSRRVELPYDFDGFVEIGETEAGEELGMRSRRRLNCGWFWCSCRCGGAAGKVNAVRAFVPVYCQGRIVD